MLNRQDILKQEKMTAVLVTHDQHEAFAVADAPQAYEKFVCVGHVPRVGMVAGPGYKVPVCVLCTFPVHS